MFNNRLIRLLLLMGAGVYAAASANAQNLLLNPGFESPELVPPQTQASGATDWTTFNTASVRSTRSHTGNQSFRLAPNAPTGTGFGIARQVIPAAANEVYSFGIWVLNPSGEPLTGPRKAQLRLQWRNGSGTLINQEILDVLVANSPTDVWTFVKLENVVLPDNANIAELWPSLFVINGEEDGGGSVYFDDAILVASSEIASGPQVLAQIPASPFSNNILSGDPLPKARYVFSEPVTVSTADISVTNGLSESVTFSLTTVSPQIIEVVFDTSIDNDTYTIVLHDTIVSQGYEAALDGDQDGLSGGDATFTLTHVDGSADLDLDGDVDLADFEIFQLAFTGPLL